MIEVQNSVPNPQVSEVVLFPFDRVSIPFSHGLETYLVPGKPMMGSRNPIVLKTGDPGEPDDEVVRFYGTVIPVGDELRMWYLARGTHDSGGGLRLCYAVSRDGLNWEKPNLGLVEYNGSKDNNIVDLLGGAPVLAAAPIIDDPDDPERRFKIVFETWNYQNGLAVAWSPDGFTWTESPLNPVGPWLEQSGLIKFNGCYYVNGQGGAHPGIGRQMVTYASHDFEHWSSASCLGFRRENVWPRPLAQTWNIVEEVHLGAGLWDRGNVILGAYGMWHGHPSGDRSFISMDIGLIISHDALHFHEPAPDFRLIPAYEERDSPYGRGPSVAQGQAMCNWGDKTMCWYELWGLGNIRVATWSRDRLGYAQTFWKGQGMHSISCPIQTGNSPAAIYLNADGLGEYTSLIVELLDEGFQPLPGYSGDACIPLQESGLRQQVVWKDRDSILGLDRPFRIKTTFAGIRPEDAKLYAIYVA